MSIGRQLYNNDEDVHRRGAMENQLNVYEKKMNAQLKEWSVDIAVLMVKANMAGDAAKTEYYKTIDMLEHKQDETRKKLRELKAAGNETRANVRQGAAEVWSELRAA
jgi:hypothetical protein